MSDTNTTKSLFDQVMDADENSIKEEQKILTKSKLKRKLHSAYDDASSKKLEAQEKLSNLRKSNKFANYDINNIIAESKTITAIEDLQKAIKNEYKQLFGEDMEPVEV